MEGRYEGENDIQEEKKGKHKKKKKIGKIIKIFVFTLLFAGSAVAGNRVAALRWGIHSAFSLVRQDTTAVIQNVDREALENGENIINSDDIINILLIGADKRESWTEAGRSDSCMIATIDLKHKKLKLSSLMRDMYVDIPGYEGKHKFNGSYSKGGVELLYKTMLRHFGIKVEGYALVDFAAFKKVVDKLGGVKINLTQEEYDTLMRRYHKSSVLKLKPGKNKMNGTQALAYCRERHLGNGDFDRTARQRTVLQQIFKKMKKKPVSKWYEILEAVMPEITTDLPEDKIIDYMMDVIFIGTTEIEQFRVPVDGTWKYNDNAYDSFEGRNVSVVELDVEKNREALKEFIFEEPVVTATP